MEKRNLLLVLCVVVACGALTFVIFLLNSHKDQPKPNRSNNTQRVSYVGQLESVDTTGMAMDGPGIFKVQVNKDTLTINLDAGESACDRTAIRVPEVKAGDKISVSGDRGADGIVRVCATGTFIKASN